MLSTMSSVFSVNHFDYAILFVINAPCLYQTFDSHTFLVEISCHDALDGRRKAEDSRLKIQAWSNRTSTAFQRATIEDMEDGNTDLIEIELATVLTDGPSLQEDEIHRVLDETSNATILNHGQADYLPCLSDIHLKLIQTSDVFKRMLKILDSEVVQKIGRRPEFFRQELQLALYQTQIFPGLPDPTSQSRHV